MRRLHIAVFSFPHDPQINPVLPVIEVLARRGHRVSVAASERFAPRIEASGAEVVSCVPFHVKDVFDYEAGLKPKHGHPFCRIATQTLRQTEEFYRINRPDVILYDLVAFAGRIVAKRLGVPAVQTSAHFAINREMFAEQLQDADFRTALHEDGRAADEFLQTHDVASSDFLFFRERLNIYFFPKVLQPAGVIFEDRSFFAGRCAGEQAYYGEWTTARAKGKEVVLVSTSTSYVRGPEYFRLCLSALQGLGFHVVLSIGESGVPEALQPLPEDCEIVQGIAHVRILPYTKLFVCMGGTTTSAEAAYHGVPLIVVSHGFQEPEWMGDNTERVGLGIHIKKSEMNERTLRAAVIRAATDETLRSRVNEIQRAVRKEPGSEETATRIEEYVEMRL